MLLYLPAIAVSTGLRSEDLLRTKYGIVIKMFLTTLINPRIPMKPLMTGSYKNAADGASTTY